MAKSARTRVIRELPPPEAEPLESKTISLPTKTTKREIAVQDGKEVSVTENPDGSVTVDFSVIKEKKPISDKFDANLAESLTDDELTTIATDLLDGIERDESSRRDWITLRAQGISLLGLTIESPRGNAGVSSAPVEGMSTIRHPVLLEAVVRFQATARGELLPASGPVKVRDDTPPGTSKKPPLALPPPVVPPQQDPQAGMPGVPIVPPPPVPETPDPELDANALETDMNHWLTSVATEWYPDTDRMLFLVGLGGDGFKKVYHCPIRRRPVSESVDADDLIVSNSATDLKNCGRVTHRIRMRPSILKRMQVVGAYRDIEISKPAPEKTDAVKKEKQKISGQTDSYKRQDDLDHTVYESYCELYIEQDNKVPAKLSKKKVPVPYRVTLEKDSRKVLSIVRNWKAGDDQCLPKQFFVQFPFIRGIGFYGLGYIHLLGNTANTLTAGWRMMTDGGMYSNFPGFIVAKSASRQNTNNFRVPPGGGIQLDVASGSRLADMIMPIPYKEIGPSFASFMQHVEERADRLGMIGNIEVGEGKQNAPVGTTLALIEQATKTIDSAHKRLHAAQAEEFALLKERFKENPESFLTHSKNLSIPWSKEQFVRALNNYNLVPVSDPNNPTSLHRAAKAQALKELQKASPQLYDAKAVDMRVLNILNINTEGLFNDKPAPPPPDPRFEAIKAKSQATQLQAQMQQLQAQIQAEIKHAELQDRAQDRASREKIENMKMELEHLRMEREAIIHQHEAAQDMLHEHVKAQQDFHIKEAEAVHNINHENIAKAHDIERMRAEHEHEMQVKRDQHDHEMRTAVEKHAMEMKHKAEQHAVDLEHAKQLAKAKAAAIAKAPKKANNTKK